MTIDQLQQLTDRYRAYISRQGIAFLNERSFGIQENQRTGLKHLIAARLLDKILKGNYQYGCIDIALPCWMGMATFNKLVSFIKTTISNDQQC